MFKKSARLSLVKEGEGTALCNCKRNALPSEIKQNKPGLSPAQFIGTFPTATAQKSEMRRLSHAPGLDASSGSTTLRSGSSCHSRSSTSPSISLKPVTNYELGDFVCSPILADTRPSFRSSCHSKFQFGFKLELYLTHMTSKRSTLQYRTPPPPLSHIHCSSLTIQ